MRAAWRILPDERTILYSPVGLRLVDGFSGGSPLRAITTRLELQVNGSWLETDIQPVITQGWVLTFPGLGRAAEPATAPVRRYRARIDAEPLYRPQYLATVDGVEFDAMPYNDTNPPATIPVVPDVVLLPSAAYPFPRGVPVIGGIVRKQPPPGQPGARPKPVENAVVESEVVIRGTTRRERTLTDNRGSFRLPLRWMPVGPLITVRARDERTGDAASIDVRLPDAVGQAQFIDF